MLVAGVDSSTQSTKVMLCQADDGTVVGQASAPHPDGTECDPELWWQALAAAGDGLLDRAEAVGVAAQQHGMVVVDEAGQVIRPALLWNDVRSAPQARALISELGGPEQWASQTGSVPTASFTVTKLRWLAEHEPDAAARTARVMLPHDWLTWRLAGGGPNAGSRAGGAAGGGAGAAGAAEPATDRGDASGTGYFSPATGAAGLSRLALAAPPGAQGLVLLPYLDGERSPNRPDASGVLRGLTSLNSTPENLARAAVEAVLCSLADAIGNLADCGITAQRVILIGGAARSDAVRRIAPQIFGVPVTVPSPAEYVALGAARQAAWALLAEGGAGAAEAPAWPLAGTSAEYTAQPA